MDIRMYASKHRSTNTNVPVIKYAASNGFRLDTAITKLSPLVAIMMIEFSAYSHESFLITCLCEDNIQSRKYRKLLLHQ